MIQPATLIGNEDLRIANGPVKAPHIKSRSDDIDPTRWMQDQKILVA
jgi:hypothetical protein